MAACVAWAMDREDEPREPATRWRPQTAAERVEIKLMRAMAPDEMEETPCGVCGNDFEPGAVLACLVLTEELPRVCEHCLAHLARRAEYEPIPADWDKVYMRYLAAVREHPEPVFASLEALLEAEGRCPPGYGLEVPVL